VSSTKTNPYQFSLAQLRRSVRAFKRKRMYVTKNSKQIWWKLTLAGWWLSSVSVSMSTVSPWRPLMVGALTDASDCWWVVTRAPVAVPLGDDEDRRLLSATAAKLSPAFAIWYDTFRSVAPPPRAFLRSACVVAFLDPLSLALQPISDYNHFSCRFGH